MYEYLHVTYTRTTSTDIMKRCIKNLSVTHGPEKNNNRQSH